jgi:uncharacterized membrane protein YbhN (UPF0104 family)
LEPAATQPRGRSVLVGPGADASESLRVSVWNRRQALLRFFRRLWRVTAFRDAPGPLRATPRAQVENEAAVERLARESGANVPVIVFAGTADGSAILAERVSAGPCLADVRRDELTDDVLARLWQQLQLLHSAGVAHGRPDDHHVIVTDGVPSLVGFESATASMRDHQSARDIAQLLAATAATVGPDRAVAAAHGALGPRLADALPYVQPTALSGWTHDAFGGRSDLDQHLERLRATAEQVLDTDAPPPRSLYRIHPRTLLLAIGTLVAIATLLSRIGSPTEFWNTIRDADWLLVLLAFLLGMLRDVVYGVTFLGNVPIRIPVWPSIELQVAMAFSHLAVPVASDAAIQVRFLQKNGVDIPSAIATGGVLSAVTEIGVQIGVFLFALWLSPDSLNFGHIDTGNLAVAIAVVVFVIAAVAAVLLGVQRLRQLVLAPVRHGLGTVWQAMKSPARVALLFGGNVVAQLIAATSLLVCLHAFGATANFWTVLAISTGVGLVASVVPVPGGGTVVSAIGLAGTFVAIGIPQATAGAAVLTYQLVHSYLPVIPGWFATSDLIRKQML